MSLPERYDLTIEQGATLKRWFAMQLPDGTIVNPTTYGSGYTIGRLQVRDASASDDGVLLLELTTDNGGVVLGALTDADGRSWSGYLYASATATAALVPFGEAIFDFEISDGTDVVRIMQGIATLSPEVSV